MKTYLPLLILISGALVLYQIQIMWGNNERIAWLCICAVILLSAGVRGWVAYKR